MPYINKGPRRRATPRRFHGPLGIHRGARCCHRQLVSITCKTWMDRASWSCVIACELERDLARRYRTAKGRCGANQVRPSSQRPGRGGQKGIERAVLVRPYPLHRVEWVHSTCIRIHWVAVCSETGCPHGCSQLVGSMAPSLSHQMRDINLGPLQHTLTEPSARPRVMAEKPRHYSR